MQPAAKLVLCSSCSAEGLPRCHSSWHRALSPQVDASGMILHGLSVHHVPLGWQSCSRSLLSSSCQSPRGEQVGGDVCCPGCGHTWAGSIA